MHGGGIQRERHEGRPQLGNGVGLSRSQPAKHCDSQREICMNLAGLWVATMPAPMVVTESSAAESGSARAPKV